MKVAIFGCGLIGQKRAKSLGSNAQLAVTVDPILARAEALAAAYPGAVACDDWRVAVDRQGFEIAIIATTPNFQAEITAACLRAGAHVLVEKPGARLPAEFDDAIAASKESGKIARVGFNHRYHPSLQKAHEIAESGVLGPLMFIRGRYGHGGRPGYDREWRADKSIGGGGELLDQGLHLIDLSRWFLGDFTHIEGFVNTYFWDMPVEDNGFLSLRTAARQMAWLHVSWTEWKNCFSYEIYGRDGKLQIEGLGGSYGVEQLAYYKMSPEMGPPETTIWQYPGADKSWDLEFHRFREEIAHGSKIMPDLGDAQAALRIVNTVYEKQSEEDQANQGMTQP